MSEIVSDFIVERAGERDIILKQMDTRLVVVIDIFDFKYEKCLERKINSLSRGDIIEAGLESKNFKKTVWKFTDIRVK